MMKNFRNLLMIVIALTAFVACKPGVYYSPEQSRQKPSTDAVMAPVPTAASS